MRLIDADILERSLTEIDEHINMDIFTNEVRELIDTAPTVEAIPKDQYEARLKADMVAMLEEICLKMDKVSFTRNNDYGVYARTPAEIRKEYSDIIQEKIKAIEGNEDGK